MSVLNKVLDFYQQHPESLSEEEREYLRGPTQQEFDDFMKSLGYREIKEGDTYDSLSMYSSVMAGLGYVKD